MTTKIPYCILELFLKVLRIYQQIETEKYINLMINLPQQLPKYNLIAVFRHDNLIYIFKIQFSPKAQLIKDLLTASKTL